MSNPFALLGLPVRADLSDDQVRTAWRAIATATHPDRPGGGDPARYAAASAAYAALRTPWGRSEAYADEMASASAPAVAAARLGRRAAGVRLARRLVLAPARVRHGRPGRLALRVVAALLLGVLTARSGAGGPASAGVVVGLGVWLVLSGRGDLAPPPGR
jgi:hypothetical protein